MLFAQVAPNGLVQNVIVADDEDVARAVTSEHFRIVECTDSDAGMGWTWDGEAFVPPSVEEPSQPEG